VGRAGGGAAVAVTAVEATGRADEVTVTGSSMGRAGMASVVASSSSRVPRGSGSGSPSSWWWRVSQLPESSVNSASGVMSA
jgi:hypothetical protein